MANIFKYSADPFFLSFPHLSFYFPPIRFDVKDRFSVAALNKQQDSQCTYNVTMWNVRTTIVAVEKQ